MLMLQNKTTFDILVSTPDGAGVTVKPTQYIEGEFFKGLSPRYWRELGDGEEDGYIKAYSTNYDSNESSTLKVCNDMLSLKEVNVNNLEINPGQVYYYFTKGINAHQTPSEIYVTWPINNKEKMKFYLNSLELDENYDGPGFKYYLSNGVAVTEGGAEFTINETYPSLVIENLKAYSEEEVQGPVDDVELVLNGDFSNGLTNWYVGSPGNESWELVSDPVVGVKHISGGEFQLSQHLNPRLTLDDIGKEVRVIVHASIPAGQQNQISLNRLFTMTSESPDLDVTLTVTEADGSPELTLNFYSYNEFPRSGEGVILSVSALISQPVTEQRTVNISSMVIGKGLETYPIPSEMNSISNCYYVILNEELDLENDATLETKYFEIPIVEDEVVFKMYTISNDNGDIGLPYRYKYSGVRWSPATIDDP